MFLPLNPPPSPPPPDPVPITPTVTVTVTVPQPPSRVSVVDLPTAVYDKLNNLDRMPAHLDDTWERFIESPPALASSFGALIAVVAILVSARMVRKQIRTSTGLVKQQIEAARQKDVEAAKRSAVIDASDGLQHLYDALVDIDYARRDKNSKPDLSAYDAAFAGSRRALNKLRLFKLDRNLIVEYDRVRDAASEFVHGQRDRTHPELKEFSERRRAMNTSLGALVELDLDAVRSAEATSPRNNQARPAEEGPSTT